MDVALEDRMLALKPDATGCLIARASSPAQFQLVSWANLILSTYGVGRAVLEPGKFKVPDEANAFYLPSHDGTGPDTLIVAPLPGRSLVVCRQLLDVQPVRLDRGEKSTDIEYRNALVYVRRFEPEPAPREGILLPFRQKRNN